MPWSPTDHEVAIEGAEDLAAGVVGDDVRDVGLDVELRVRPDFAGDLNTALEFGNGMKRADDNVGGHKSFR